MKTFDVSRLPTMIALGYDGENNWRPNQFDCSALLANHPNGTISLWLLPHGETQAFPVALERDENVVVWTPLSEEMSAATGSLQLVCTDGTDVGKSAVVLFRVDESILPGAEHPAAVPSWATNTIERAESAADRAEEAAESIDIEQIEQTIADAVEEYLREHPVDVPVQSVNGKTGAVTLSASDVGAMPSNYTPPVTSVNGKTGAVSLDAEDVGALPSDTPIPSAVTEQDVANWGFTKNTGNYTKPSGGIPKTDLAANVQTSLGKADTALQTAPVTSVNSKTGAVTLGASDVHALPDSTVIPVVPQMATQTDMSDWTSGKTVDASVLAQDFGIALDSLGAVDSRVDALEADGAALETIADITFDGNTALDISTDANGQAFRLKKAVLMVSNGAASANGTVMFQFRLSNVFVYRAYTSYSANQAGRVVFAKVWQENQRWYGEHLGFANNGYGGVYTQTENLSAWLTKTVSTYPYIDNVYAGWTPPEGTRAILLGVRA